MSFIAVVYAMKTKSPGGVINEGTDNVDYDDIEELDRSCEAREMKHMAMLVGEGGVEI